MNQDGNLFTEGAESLDRETGQNQKERGKGRNNPYTERELWISVSRTSHQIASSLYHTNNSEIILCNKTNKIQVMLPLCLSSHHFYLLLLLFSEIYLFFSFPGFYKHGTTHHSFHGNILHNLNSHVYKPWKYYILQKFGCS